MTHEFAALYDSEIEWCFKCGGIKLPGNPPEWLLPGITEPRRSRDEPACRTTLDEVKEAILSNSMKMEPDGVHKRSIGEVLDTAEEALRATARALGAPEEFLSGGTEYSSMGLVVDRTSPNIGKIEDWPKTVRGLPRVWEVGEEE